MVKKLQTEFDLRKEIIKLQSEMNKENHARIMEELKYRRESERINHEHGMERQRIKSAEIRKMQMRKEAGGYKY